MLDIMLCLHAEHGGGNNSSFTTHVLTSADTDAYSTYAAAIGSLKGRKHGGANHQVLAMQKEIKDNVVNWENDDEVAAYLAKIVNKQAYDKSGLVYGMGHAVYTLSDPRAVICKRFAEKLAIGTEFEAEFRLLEKIERLAPEVILNEKGTRKDMCANVDMYSGFVYSMLGIPEDLFTPLFACLSHVGLGCASLRGNRLGQAHHPSRVQVDLQQEARVYPYGRALSATQRKTLLKRPDHFRALLRCFRMSK